MELLSDLAAALIIAVSGALLYWLTRRVQAGNRPGLRPLKGYEAVTRQVGRAVESGKSVHVALGRASLATSANPTTLAALEALEVLAQDGCASNVPPQVSVGEATLLPAAQDSLRAAYDDAGRPADFAMGSVQFIASDAFPMAYAAGVSDVIGRGDVGSNLMLGRFGSELAIMTEAGQRAAMEQVVATDEPVAMALGAAVTDNLLIGEELFAAGGYLQGKPDQLANLQLQDILRYLVILGILLATLLSLVVD